MKYVLSIFLLISTMSFAEKCDTTIECSGNVKTTTIVYENDTLFHMDQKDSLVHEVIIEKILCHDSTRGLSISINDNVWMEIAEADSIPYPQWDYQHHIYPVTEIPLSCAFLSAG